MKKDFLKRLPKRVPQDDAFPLVGVRGELARGGESFLKRSARACRKATDAELHSIRQECAAIAAARLRRGDKLLRVAEDAVAWGHSVAPQLSAAEARRIVREVKLGKLTARSTLAPPQNVADDEADDPGLEKSSLARLGFPPDYWLPSDLAQRWKGTLFPRDCSPASLKQWLDLAGITRQATIVTRLIGGSEAASRMLQETIADARLLEAFFTGGYSLVEGKASRKELLRVLHEFFLKSGASNVPDAVADGIGPEKIGQERDGREESNTRPSPKEPSREAIAAYRASLATGKTQAELASLMAKELKRKVDQGTISRWLKQVKGWIKAGNVLPDLHQSLDKKPTPMDPGRLDLGERMDRRAKHQRDRRTSDHDD